MVFCHRIILNYFVIIKFTKGIKIDRIGFELSFYKANLSRTVERKLPQAVTTILLAYYA